MKLIYNYIWVIVGILLFLGVFGVIGVLGQLGFGVQVYVEATKYMSVAGKVTYFVLTAGVFVFLIKFVVTRDAK